jgi:hypothetical protein
MSCTKMGRMQAPYPSRELRLKAGLAHADGSSGNPT